MLSSKFQRPLVVFLFLTLSMGSIVSSGLGAAVGSDPIRVTGKVQAVYNKGNGLYSYFIVIGPKKKYRIFAHILDPDQARKEKTLTDAAQKNLSVAITGILHRDLKEDAIEVKEIIVDKP